MKQKDNKPGITKVKWGKVDKEWYEVILRQNISSIKHKLVTGDMPIKVITKLPNSEQSYKGKVKTHNYINRQNQSTTGKL